MPQRLRTSPVTVGLAATMLAGALVVGGRSTGGAPPLGALLDPVHGVWALARTATPPDSVGAAIPGLAQAVDVRFDDRGVPHIFAASMADAVRALGYVHARDRLFQLEIQTRAVAGTLAELLGERALPLDREARAQGLAVAMTRGYDGLPATSASRVLANAYAEGVNAFVGGMTRSELPLEFRLLGATPQHWEPKYTAYLFGRMGLTLAYSDGELRRAAVEALVGREATDALFPRNAPIQEPIQPNGLRVPRQDVVTLPAPNPADSARLRGAVAALDASRVTRLALRVEDDAPDDVSVGSNNWAVSPKRSATGNALLAGDPHLSLTLPSIWYEAHLVVPESLDVYGVTLVGSPLPPIGFNRDVAWSETNTGADVADYFVESVDDATRPHRYQVDGAWRPLRERVEVIRGRRERVLATDTVLETHRGPMLRSSGAWVSRRWVVTDAYDVVGPFLKLARARSVADARAATDSFFAPAQNFVSADRTGHIGMRSTGRFPLRARGVERGDVLLDGSRSASDWQGWWPLKDYPQAYDPPQGYVVSANQQPKDPHADPRYLGWDWPSPWRAMRINEMLRADSTLTPDKMRRMQTDPVSVHVRTFLPAMIAAAEAGADRDTVLARAATILREWDGRLDAENTQAVLYEVTMGELAQRTWDELRTSAPGERPRLVSTPEAMLLTVLLRDPESPWWDDRSTANVRERRDDIIRASILAAWSRLSARLGPPGPAWRWGASRRATVRHILRFDVLSRLSVPVTGGPGSVSPSFGDGNHGASWRMVVELGPEVRAWGTYPGGQSGNPISPRYAEFLGKWSAGTLDTLRFPRSAGDLPSSLTSARIALRPAP